MPNLMTVKASYREARRVMRHGPSYPWRRYVAPSRILRLPAIHTDEVGDVTMCVLTSSRDWLLCLWSLASFYFFSGLRLPLLIYSDGSLDRSHRERIESIFPKARIIDPTTADAAVSSALSLFPNCSRFRATQPCARRIIDFPILCKSNSILMLDSDVLFFGRPDELVKYITSQRAGQFVFERDLQDAYFDSPEGIRTHFQIDIASRVNCGIMLADISSFDHALIENWLRNASSIERHPWAEQTLWAMYAARDRTSFLSKEYDVSLSAEIGPDTLIKHYIKPIRDFMYTEGIPYLNRRLEEKAH